MEKPLPLNPSHLSTRDYIARTLGPLVAVAASEDAEELCRVNRIPSFADFIKPFGDMLEGRGTCLNAPRKEALLANHHYYHHTSNTA